MIRGTTPTFRLTIAGKSVDLTKAEHIYVTLTQKGTEITLTGDDLSVTQKTVACFLPQKQSLLLKEGESAEIQVNWTYEDDLGNTRRGATKTKEIPIEKQLLKRVIE